NPPRDLNEKRHGSVSQLQIMIWTMVIGAGVIYVMILLGKLIDIPATMLGLLGISGGTLALSKLQAGMAGPPSQPNMPGAVRELTLSGTPTGSTVVLSWQPPAGPPSPLTYTVQFRCAG